ncbi:MAG: Uma2 family endonuclease [Eubacteriales bacterium]|nr:Uma2 family endonuclease [Eubacteriales bacterium]
MDDNKRNIEDGTVYWNEYGERMYPDYMKEAQTAYQTTGDPALGRFLAKKQGEYTIEDYYALPEECRVELIDGVIYNMAAPSGKHQDLGGYIHAQFLYYILRNKGKCLARMAPSDVQLDRDSKTMVQPDVYIGCEKDKFKNRVYYGAPDLVIEVLSPSSRKKDREIKYRKYKNAGVREYWVVDPEAERVTVHDFEHGGTTRIYTFEDRVPVGIWDGKCQVDFAEALEMTRFLLEE